MIKLEKIYSKEIMILLEAVVQTDLPVVIDGNPDTSHNVLGEYFLEKHGYGFISGVEDMSEHSVMMLFKSLKNAKGNRIVIIKQQLSSDFTNDIGHHIRIKTFKNNITGERYIHIIPSTSVTGVIRELLGKDNPLVLVVGEHSNKFESDISKQDGVITVDITSEAEFLSFYNTMVTGIKLVMEHADKEKYLDVIGSNPVVSKIDIDAVKSDILVEFLKGIKENPDKLGIYIQGYTKDYKKLRTDLTGLFNVQVF